MKNKKILNTILLGLALVLFVGLILEFCKVVGATVLATTSASIFYYVFNIIGIVAVAVIIVLGIFNLFKDNYSAIKLSEFAATSALLMIFLTLIVFATTGSTASFGYVTISVLTFAMAMFSQIWRLCTIFKTFKADVATTLGIKFAKKEKKPAIPELKKGNKTELKEEKKPEVVEGEIVNK